MTKPADTDDQARDAEPAWWRKPYRIIQTNLREIDAGLDPQRLVDGVVGMHANVLLFNVGGIVAFYPTDLPLHERSAYLQSDLLGDVIARAHAASVRVVGRFDFSKASRKVYEEHPDWFFAHSDGTPVNYNGKYHACVNGGWYRGYADKILTEALGRYDLDGAFFNMFGYQVRDYSGTYHGICQCVNCRTGFDESFGQPLPTVEDPADPIFRNYRLFRERTSRDVAEHIYDIAKAARPSCAVMMRIPRSELLRMEVNRALDRRLPAWSHEAGEQARIGASTGRGKNYSSAIVHFIDIPFRHAAESGACQALRLDQQVANGAQPDYYMVGTLDQADTKTFNHVRRLFAHHEANEQLYSGLTSAAEVAIVRSQASFDLGPMEAFGRQASAAFRGIYRILAESHIPFDLITDARLDGDDAGATLARYRTILLPDVSVLNDDACSALDDWVSGGGHLVSTNAPGALGGDGTPAKAVRLRALGIAAWSEWRSDMRSSNFELDLAGLELPDTTVVMCDGGYWYTELDDEAEGHLRLQPPQRFGPPELCYPEVTSTRPGLILNRLGSGTSAYLPWQPDALYHQHSIDEHRHLIAALTTWNQELPLVTVIGPAQVEVTVHEADDGSMLVHLVNFSGNQGTAYHEPIPVHEVRVALRTGGEPYRTATCTVAGTELVAGEAAGGAADRSYSWFTIPVITDFEAVHVRR